MRWRRHSAEEIVGKLSRVRELVGYGQPLTDAIKASGISQATYFRWRVQYGSLSLPQVRQLKQLALENARLRSALAEMEMVAGA